MLAGERQSARNDAARWQQHCTKLLQTFQNIDPEEHERLKDDREMLLKEKAEAAAQAEKDKQAVSEQAAALNASIAELQKVVVCFETGEHSRARQTLAEKDAIILRLKKVGLEHKKKAEALEAVWPWRYCAPTDVAQKISLESQSATEAAELKQKLEDSLAETVALTTKLEQGELEKQKLSDDIKKLKESARANINKLRTSVQEKEAELAKSKEDIAAAEARAAQPSESELHLKLQTRMLEKKLAFASRARSLSHLIDRSESDVELQATKEALAKAKSTRAAPASLLLPSPPIVAATTAPTATPVASGKPSPLNIKAPLTSAGLKSPGLKAPPAASPSAAATAPPSAIKHEGDGKLHPAKHARFEDDSEAAPASVKRTPAQVSNAFCRWNVIAPAACTCRCRRQVTQDTHRAHCVPFVIRSALHSIILTAAPRTQESTAVPATPVVIPPTPVAEPAPVSEQPEHTEVAELAVEDEEADAAETADNEPAAMDETADEHSHEPVAEETVVDVAEPHAEAPQEDEGDDESQEQAAPGDEDADETDGHDAPETCACSL